MKMITAIVNRKDINTVSECLNEAHFEFTKLATTGGFLRAGNTTLLVGVDDDKLDEALSIIRENSSRRVEKVPEMVPTPGGTLLTVYPAEVIVGGAIVFVTDVAYFEKM